MPISIAILGASGYTGAELIRILLGHPHVNIAALTGDSQAGRDIGEIYPHLRFKRLPRLTTINEVDFSKIDVAFCCLPHGTSQPVITQLLSLPHRGRVREGAGLLNAKEDKVQSKIAPLPDSPLQGEGLRVIDLSADFRLADPRLYEIWYGHAHQAIGLQKEAIYGLTEIYRAETKKARLVANPGCYPTSALLPLIPLLKEKLILPEDIIIDAKSGVTGAGRSAKQANLFAEIDGGISAYGIAKHRHAPEIEQGLGVPVTFTPHLIPMSRGILSTIYVKPEGKNTADDLRAALHEFYKGEPFVHILPEGAMPSTHQVRGTNDCIIGVFAGPIKGQAILVSVIDNLVKGASGQAVQNMNLMFGWPEDTGLKLAAIFP